METPTKPIPEIPIADLPKWLENYYEDVRSDKSLLRSKLLKKRANLPVYEDPSI